MNDWLRERMIQLPLLVAELCPMRILARVAQDRRRRESLRGAGSRLFFRRADFCRSSIFSSLLF